MQTAPGREFGTIGCQQVAVTGEVIGPVAGHAPLALTAEDGVQAKDEGVPALQADAGQLLGPEGQQAREIAHAVVGALRRRSG